MSDKLRLFLPSVLSAVITAPTLVLKFLRDGTLNRCLNQIVFHYINNITTRALSMKSFGQRLLPVIICIMDLSEVINRPCSYSRFLISFLSSALRWITTQCATCRWAALLWLPCGHQILHIYSPWIMASLKNPQCSTFLSPPPVSLSPFLHHSAPYSHFFFVHCVAQSFSHFHSSFPGALILLCAFPAA